MFKFPIAFKLIIMTIVILLAVTIPLAKRISNLVIQESGDRERENNRSQAASRAKELDITMQNLVEKTKVLGTLLLQQSISPNHSLFDSSSQKSFHFQFQRDLETINLSVFETGKRGPIRLGQKSNENLLQEYKIKESYLRKLDEKRSFPIGSVFAGNIEVVNRSIPKGVPLVSIGVPLVKNKLGRVTHIAIADIKLYSIQKGFSEVGVRDTYLVDSKGRIMAHPQEQLAINATKYDLPIIKLAHKSKASSGQMNYFNKKRREKMVAAYSKTAFNLVVISEAPESVILEPARNVQRNVYYITGFVLCIAVFVVFLFALSLTRPIERLVYLTQQIAKGNFSTRARMVVKSRDEVGELALAFDKMVAGLRERDKIKNVLNKFHGTSVAKDLIAGGTDLRGKRKKVAVFFSDIREFTSFSEKRTPEQVVSMLNEYFAHMVTKIYKRNGVVDKFIGDAIMAVWGAPNSSGDDAYDCVMACLEMRKALEKLNKTRIARKEQPLLIGMGVHFGYAISGTIGSLDRLEYTVIGDAVNMAARIEAATKSLGVDFLISEDVYNHLKGRLIAEPCGVVEVKGKSKALSLYYVKGYIKDGKKAIVDTPYAKYSKEDDAKVKVT